MTDYHVWCHFFFNSTNRCQFGRNHYSIHTTLTLFSLALPESFVCFVVSTSVTSTLWLCTTSCCPTKSDRLLSNMNKTINNVAIRINATYNDEFRFQCVVIFTQNCLILFKFLFFCSRRLVWHKLSCALYNCVRELTLKLLTTRGTFPERLNLIRSLAWPVTDGISCTICGRCDFSGSPLCWPFSISKIENRWRWAKRVRLRREITFHCSREYYLFVYLTGIFMLLL